MIIHRNFKQINHLLTSKRYIWFIPVGSFLFKLNSTYPMESETKVVFGGVSLWLKIPAMGWKFLEKDALAFFDEQSIQWNVSSTVYLSPW